VDKTMPTRWAQGLTHSFNCKFKGRCQTAEGCSPSPLDKCVLCLKVFGPNVPIFGDPKTNRYVCQECHHNNKEF